MIYFGQNSNITPFLGDTKLKKVSLGDIIIWEDENPTPPTVQYTVTGTAINCTVEGYGTYPSGATCTLKAVEDEGYQFTQWSDGDQHNPKIFTVTSDTTIDVTCERQYLVTGTAINCSVEGYGKYLFGETCELYAIPDAGYQFTHWSDGELHNPRYETVYGDMTFDVRCEEEPPSVKAYVSFTTDRDGTIGWTNTTPALEYSYDKTNWSFWDLNGLSLNSNQTLYFRGFNPGGTRGGHFTWNASSHPTANLTVDGNVQALNDYNTLPSTAENMTFLFTSLPIVSANTDLLPATTLTPNCYGYMFSGCTKLTNAPALPVTELAESCYSCMFYGCTSLTGAPALPATTLVDECYGNMFHDCRSLTEAPALSATALAYGCYQQMFRGCTSLTEAPALPATALANWCYFSMFEDCRSLTGAPELPATVLTSYCYGSMFEGCESLRNAPALPATTLTKQCYQFMFYGCTSLTGAPALPATTLADECYGSMFEGCRSLATAPALPANTLTEHCYDSMFQGCTRLTEAPALPSTALASNCYESMFEGCTSLTEAPDLPATTLATQCYFQMFYGCSNLNYIKCLATNPRTGDTNSWVSGVSETGTFVKAQGVDWPTGDSGIPVGWTVETEGNFAYSDISSQKFDPSLYPLTPDKKFAFKTYTDTMPDRWLGRNGSYLSGMTLDTASTNIDACVWSIEQVSEGIYKVKNEEGYYFYFNGERTSLDSMSLVNIATDAVGVRIGKPAGSPDYVYGFQEITQGFGLNNLYGRDTEPNWWTENDIFTQETDNFVYFQLYEVKKSGDEKNYISITTDQDCTIGWTSSSPYLEYSYDNANWQYWLLDGLSLNTNQTLYFRGLNPNGTGGGSFTCNNAAANLTLDGNVQALLDYENPPSTAQNMVSLFMGMPIVSVNYDLLPATALAEECYRKMFSGCTKLTVAPELPATVLTDNCYKAMFQGCTSLTTAPEMSATTLAGYSFYNMLRDCTSLSYIKCLATNPNSSNCYYWVNNVSATGTFVKKAGVTWPTGKSGIPTGWTVEEI